MSKSIEVSSDGGSIRKPHNDWLNGIKASEQRLRVAYMICSPCVKKAFKIGNTIKIMDIMSTWFWRRNIVKVLNVGVRRNNHLLKESKKSMLLFSGEANVILSSFKLSRSRGVKLIIIMRSLC